MSALDDDELSDNDAMFMTRAYAMFSEIMTMLKHDPLFNRRVFFDASVFHAAAVVHFLTEKDDNREAIRREIVEDFIKVVHHGMAAKDTP